MAKLFGKAVRFEFEMPAEQGSQKREDGIVWRKDVRRHDVQSDEDGFAVTETESFVEWLILEKQVENQEHEEDIQF